MAKKVIVAIIFVLTCALLVWILLFWDVFAIKKANIELLNEEGYINKTAVATKIESLDNARIWLLNTDQLQDEFNAIEGVESTQIKKKYPDSLIISFEPKVAKGQVKSGDKYTVLDASADVITVVDKEVANLPVLDLDLNPEHKETNSACVQAVSAIGDELKGEVVRASAKDKNSVQTQMKSGVTVYWGSMEDIAYKTQIAVRILKDKKLIDGKSWLDISSPETPALK
ncbi:MAG: cell division protein FtsQ/DivIB [Bifidobacteriaceae bacterium]|jgi:cell division septal protein FtsQ|nr:cell division protein FtsQ/DivIB [Bifidobacteriaceae bacterium]